MKLCAAPAAESEVTTRATSVGCTAAASTVTCTLATPPYAEIVATLEEKYPAPPEVDPRVVECFERMFVDLMRDEKNIYKLGKKEREYMHEIIGHIIDNAHAFELDPWDVLRFMLANEPLTGTHSYGFHTRYGRAVREHFSSIYHA